MCHFFCSFFFLSSKLWIMSLRLNFLWNDTEKKLLNGPVKCEKKHQKQNISIFGHAKKLHFVYIRRLSVLFGAIRLSHLITLLLLYMHCVFVLNFVFDVNFHLFFFSCLSWEIYAALNTILQQKITILATYKHKVIWFNFCF